MSRRSLLALAAATPLALAGLAPAAESTKERFSAIAVNMSTVGRKGMSRVDLVVEKWSTEAERDELIALLVEKGPDALLSRLQKMDRMGYIQLPGKLGYDIRFAHQVERAGGGRRILLLTDRRIGFWEARNQPRLTDYPFTLIELRLGPDGKGEGKASIATKITHNLQSRTLELENYSNEPVRLNEVKLEKDE